MPELPEVETVVRTLENRINGRIINEVVVRWPKIIDNVPVDIFEKKLYFLIPFLGLVRAER